MTNISELKITETNNTIVNDFEIFLQHFNKKVKLTKASAYITRKDLKTLNEQMTNPAKNIPTTGNQPEYPHVHLFYHLAFQLDLLEKSGQTAVLHKKYADEYECLSRAEKYAALLNCFWTSVSWRALNDNNRPPYNVDVLFGYMEAFPVSKTIQLYKEKDVVDGFDEWGLFIDFFTYFGFWEVELVEKQYLHSKRIRLVAETIKLTPLFRQLEQALLETWEFEDDGFMESMDALFGMFFEEDFEDEEVEEEVESLFVLLQPLFSTGELETFFVGAEKSDRVDFD